MKTNRKQSVPAAKYKEHRRKRRDQADNIARLNERKGMLILLCAAHEKAENFDELRGCKQRLREVEQRLVYINQGV